MEPAAQGRGGGLKKGRYVYSIRLAKTACARGLSLRASGSNKAELLVSLHGVRRTHSGHQMQREREREIESQREGDGGAISAPSRRVDLGTRYAVADRLAHKESEKNRACGAHELPCATEARVKAAEGAPRKMFASMTSTRHLRSNTAVLTLSGVNTRLYCSNININNAFQRHIRLFTR